MSDKFQITFFPSKKTMNSLKVTEAPIDCLDNILEQVWMTNAERKLIKEPITYYLLTLLNQTFPHICRSDWYLSFEKYIGTNQLKLQILKFLFQKYKNCHIYRYS